MNSATQQIDNTLEQQLQVLQTQFKQLQQSYKQASYPSLEARIAVLDRLKKSIIDNEQAVYAALIEDYGYRSEFDTLIGELMPSVMNIKYTKKKLKRWMKPSRNLRRCRLVRRNSSNSGSLAG